MADAPQVVYDHSDLQVDQSREQPILEYNHDYSSKEAAAQYRAIDGAVPQYPTILGLRRRYFWIVLVLAIVIIAASVGGSVGGVFAVQKASVTETAIPSQSNSLKIASTSSSLPETISAAFVSTSSSSTSSAEPYSSPTNDFNPPTIITVDNTCPENLVGDPPPGEILSAPLATPSDNPFSKRYDCLAYTRVSVAADIMALKAYTIDQCIEACSNMNIIAGSVICRAVTMTTGLSYEYENNIAANCWLKNTSQPSERADNTTLAILVLN